ncbi:uridylate-specific endoribonuclease, partial [Porphyrio hochstetteri]
MKVWILFIGAGIALGCVSSNLYTAPDSCKGRCEEPYSREDECHCDAECESHHNCCQDYYTHCQPGGGWAEEEPHTHEGFSRSQDAIRDEELLQLSEQLYTLDHNKAQPSDITLNPQYQASPEETDDQQDRSPQPLYGYVNEGLFSKPTYASFIKLLDNYQRSTGREEEVTAEELREQDNFLKEVMGTELMRKLFAFLHKK